MTRLSRDEFWNPNTWRPQPTTGTLYAGTNAEHECVVDYDDFLYFQQWLWKTKQSKRSRKLYFKRTPTGFPDVYLHIEICTRAYGPAPTRRRCIVDHIDGNSFNNRRDNLRWATRRENNLNRLPRTRINHPEPRKTADVDAG